MQGPTSFSVLKDAGLEVAGALKPFDWAELEPGLWVSRTGFTGDLGYEFWTSWDGAGQLWDRLWRAGQTWGIRAIGFEAMNITRIEAGFIAAGVEFQPVHKAVRLGRGRSPLELGFGKMVHFDKGHFNGRRALMQQRKQGLRHHLVKLDIGGFKSAHGALIYHRKRREVGHVTSGAWSPTTKRNIALAELKAPYGVDIRTQLSVEIYLHEEGQWDKRLVPVTVEKSPFFQNNRARVTPPRAF